MKKIKLIAVLIFLFTITIVQAQKIEYNGVQYVVKSDVIFIDGKDITSSLSQEQQVNIKNKLSQQQLAEEKLKAAEKAQNEAERKMRTSEKRMKRAEKELKKKETALKKYEEAQKQYEKELKKHERLSKKGKLSPDDEEKWKKKLEGLRNKSEKLKRKM